MKKKITITNKIDRFDKVIEVSGDKSISIRCILLASQAVGKSKIYNLLESEDVINSLECVKKFGIKIKKINNYYAIYGLGLKGFNTKKKIELNAGNSGTLARLILGLLIDSENLITLKGDKSLSNRDFSRIVEPLRQFGVNIVSKGNRLPVKILGSKFISPINYEEKLGSAQCKSAVMLAGLKSPGITKIKASKSRDHTELLFKDLKIPIKIKKKNSSDYIEIRGQTNFSGFVYKVPGDISSSSFFLVLTLLSEGSALIVKNVNINETRTGIIKILNKMNSKIKIKNKKKYKGEIIGDIHVRSTKELKAINCPKSLNSSAIDEFLIIFLIAAKAKGVSKFSDLGELNKKESPRLNIAIKILRMMGVKVQRNRDNIKIFGNPNLRLSKTYYINNFKKDHRVVMMSCVAALTFGGKWKIDDADSVKTSFPKFFSIITKLGAKIY